jgi:hypothetical protein
MGYRPTRMTLVPSHRLGIADGLGGRAHYVITPLTATALESSHD